MYRNYWPDIMTLPSGARGTLVAYDRNRAGYYLDPISDKVYKVRGDWNPVWEVVADNYKQFEYYLSCKISATQT